MYICELTVMILPLWSNISLYINSYFIYFIFCFKSPYKVGPMTAILSDLNGSLLDQKEYKKPKFYCIILYCIIVTKM